MQARYHDDLDDCLGNELVQFADFVDTFKDEQAKDLSLERTSCIN